MYFDYPWSTMVRKRKFISTRFRAASGGPMLALCVRGSQGGKFYWNLHTNGQTIENIYWNLHTNGQTIGFRALLYRLQNADFIAKSWKVSFNVLSMFFTNVLFLFVSKVKLVSFQNMVLLTCFTNNLWIFDQMQTILFKWTKFQSLLLGEASLYGTFPLLHDQ